MTVSPLLQAKLERLEKLRALRAKKDELDGGGAKAELPAKRFYHDPVGFALECVDFGEDEDDGLTSYQKDVLGRIPVEKRVAVRGPHGLGKSALSAIAVLWFALTRDDAGVDWKAPTTAGAWRQLERYLWPEIHKWSKRIRWDRLNRGPFDERTELLALNLKLTHGAAFAVASNKAELIEGVHADSVLYVFDESKAIPAATFEAAEGAFSGAAGGGATDDGSINLPEAFALAASTPGEPNGTFYDIHARRPGLEDWWPRHVTLEEAKAAKRISQEWADNRRRQWGEQSAAYHNRVLGEFYSSDTDGVIPLAWIELANERWKTWDESGRSFAEGLMTVGVDVARSGTDKTVLAIRFGDVIIEIRKTSREDTMKTSGRVKGLLDNNTGMTAIVDVIGIGSGVVDRLREMNMPVDAFNASSRSRRKDSTGELGFVNARAASWWNLRDLLDPSKGASICLPLDDRLLGDLTAPHWKIISGGKIQVESKDDIRKRIGRSTDTADAVIMAFWPVSGGWRDAYGVINCEDCGHLFLTSVHPERCPKCWRSYSNS